MPARLAVHLTQSPIRVWHLADDREYVVGRDPAADVWLDDGRVSQRHLSLTCRAGEWSARDLGSKNGTLVDGSPLSERMDLEHASWLSIGGVVARFEPIAESLLREEVERAVQRWQSSAELQRLLEPGLGVDALLARLLDSVLRLSDAERGFVLLDRGDGELEIRARRGLADDDLRQESFCGSAAAVDRSLAQRRPVVVSDTSEDSELAGRPSVIGAGIRTLICLPLLSDDDLLGAIYVDSRSPGVAITELDVEILEALARQAALALRLARLDGDLESLVARLSARLEHQPELADWLAGQLDSITALRHPRADRDATPSAPRSAIAAADTWGAVAAIHAGRSR